jgi:hypothetical protein
VSFQSVTMSARANVGHVKATIRNTKIWLRIMSKYTSGGRLTSQEFTSAVDRYSAPQREVIAEKDVSSRD